MRNTLASLIRRHVKVAAHPYEGVPLVLVSGVGRSGTTALRHCLSAHPDLHSTGSENNIIFDVLETARHNCTYPSRRGTMKVVQAAYDRQFRLLLLNLLWPEPCRGSRPTKLLATSDLTPDRADYLCRVFPDAQIAYIVRNGISVVSSRMAHPNFKDDPFEEHCRRWAGARDMIEWGASRREFVLVRQEDVLDAVNAEEVCRRTMEQLDLPFCPACVETMTGNRYHPTTFKDETEDAAKDLKTRADRWTMWTDEQRALFTKICGQSMLYLNYKIPWQQC